MDNRKAAEKLLGSIDVDHTQYKFGHTKVFVSICTHSRRDASDAQWIFTFGLNFRCFLKLACWVLWRK